jgi:signal peptidase
MTVLASTARRTVSLLCGLTVLLAITYSALPLVGYHPLAVYSGSMVPAIPVGTLAIDESIPSSSVRVGDVITFNDPYVAGRVVTHRVVRVIDTDHGVAYRTKGDANVTRDPWTVQLPGHVGRVAFQVPFVGYALVYAQTREIRTMLLLLVSSAVLAAVLRAIWRRPSDLMHAGV